MAKQHAYRSLEVYNLSKQLTVACYSLTQDLPQEERTNLTHYIRSAALSSFLSIAQGAFLKSKKKKKKFFGKARNALITIDAAMEILVEVGLAAEEQTSEVIRLSSACFQLISKL